MRQRSTTTTTTAILPCFSLLRVLLRLVVLVAAFSFLSSAGVEAFVRRPNNGLMKLCPPGGQSFAAAWEITCGMRRRKRDAMAVPETTTTKHNNDKAAGLREQGRENGTAIGTKTTPKSWWKAIGEMFFGPHQVGASVKQNAMASPAGDLADDAQLFRPPSMTEMMLFCCRFGCSLRDLMPYCDPFGEWDS